MSGGIGNDQKVSLRVKNNAAAPFSFTGLLAPLKGGTTGGVVFPYSPTVAFSHTANYGAYDTTHSISQPNYYVSTSNPTIGLTATFTANTIDEARYSAAALHFFKTCTKSEYGIAAGNSAGTPPPVLIFNAYGTIHSKNVPVVVANVSYNLSEDVDFVQVDDFSIPASFILTLDLRVQIPPRSTRDNFDIKGYANGSLLSSNKGFL